MQHREHRIFRLELKGQLLYNLSSTGMVSLVQTGLNKTRSWPRIEMLLQTCEQIINSDEDRGYVIKMERAGFCPYIYPCKSRTKDFLDYVCTFLSPLLHQIIHSARSPAYAGALAPGVQQADSSLGQLVLWSSGLSREEETLGKEKGRGGGFPSFPNCQGGCTFAFVWWMGSSG